MMPPRIRLLVTKRSRSPPSSMCGSRSNIDLLMTAADFPALGKAPALGRNSRNHNHIRRLSQRAGGHTVGPGNGFNHLDGKFAVHLVYALHGDFIAS